MITSEHKSWSIKCENRECGIEITLVDDIDGNITADMLEFCPVCGEHL